MGYSDMPRAEVEPTGELVRSLLEQQWPLWDGQAVSVLTNGWDNVLYRVGDSHLARMPRREMAVPLVVNEAKWLPTLANRLPLRIPVPVFNGAPGDGYPWPWNVVEWIDGESAAQSEYDPMGAAQALGSFLRALHTPAPVDAPENEFRGGPISAKTDAVRERAELVSELAPADQILTVWERVSSVAAFEGSPRWIHGDLHPHNVIVKDGRLVAIIDFGDVTAGDPATDLAAIWMLAPGHITTFRETYGSREPSIWARARAWALHLSLAYLTNSADNPTMSKIGRSTLRSVLADVAD